MLHVKLSQKEDSLYSSAKEVYLRAAKQSDWAIAWLGAGKAAYFSGEPDQAEAALNQANIRCVCCALVLPLLYLILFRGRAIEVRTHIIRAIC